MRRRSYILLALGLALAGGAIAWRTGVFEGDEPSPQVAERPKVAPPRTGRLVPEGEDGVGVTARYPVQLRGAQMHPLWWSAPEADAIRELDMLKAAGADTVRFDIAWSSLETEGKGNISSGYAQRADRFLQAVKDRGMNAIVNLWATPCWASSAPEEKKLGCTGAWWDRGVDRYAPANVNDYGDIAAFVAERWGSKLTALEIWNEPNLPDKYSLQAPDPALTYAEILKTAYPRVKAKAPNLVVLGGVLAFSDGAFLERLYALGIKGKHDGISIHPYNEWRDPDDPWLPQWRKYSFLTGVPWVRSIMQANGDGDKGLWLTEFGFSTCGTGSSWCVTEQQQAEYVNDSFRLAANWDYVMAAIVYNTRNKGSVPDDREDQFGMLRRDFAPKPGYAAFKAAMAREGWGPTAGGSTPAPDPSAGNAAGDQPSRPNPGNPVLDTTGPAAPVPFSAPLKRVRLRPGRAEVVLSCAPGARPRCEGTVAIDRRGARAARGSLGRRAIRLGAARSVTLSVPLTASGRRALRRGGRVTVTVSARVAGASTRIARRTFRVRAPR